MKQQWVARGLVAGLHAVLLAALWLYRPAGLGGHQEQRLTTVRLILPPPSRAPAAERTTPREPLPRPQAAPALIPPPPVTADAPQSPGDAAPAPAPPVAHPATEAPRTTLRLTLPPGYAASSAAARNPALGDPRSNTPRLTLEDRIADATGGAGAWVEEPTENHSLAVGAQGDRRTVLRRGNTCVEVFRSRIADSDPFNSNVAPRTMAMVGQPYKCR